MTRRNAEDTAITCKVCGYKSDEHLVGDITDHFKDNHPNEWALVEWTLAHRSAK